MFVVIVLVAMAPPPLPETNPADCEDADEVAEVVALSIALTVASPVVVTVALVMEACVVLLIVFSASETPTAMEPLSPALAAVEAAATLVEMLDVSCA